jgi:hypothetical protein
MEWIELAKNVSWLFVAWAAIYGLDAWRREHIGKRQLELSEETLALFYEAKDAIHHIRHPASFSSETDVVVKTDHESQAQFDARRNASVVFKRYNEHQELFNKLHAMRYRFMAQIGVEEAQPFEELRKITNEITGAAMILARLWPRDHFRTKEQQKNHRNQIEKYEAVFWEGLADDDPINPRVEEQIAKMESTCKAIISGQGTLYGFFNWKLLKFR